MWRRPWGCIALQSHLSPTVPLTSAFCLVQGQRKQGQHGGGRHGHGNKGSKARQSFMRAGFEGGQTPFYLRVPIERPYRGHHLKRQYTPVSLHQLQVL